MKQASICSAGLGKFARVLDSNTERNIMDKNLITSFFEEDHDKLDALFSKFQATRQTEPAAAGDLLGRFIHGLLRHIDWEEQILFPLFEANVGSAMGPTQVMRFEHGQIKNLLESIRLKLSGATDSADDEKTLLNVLGEHNWKEEHILYPAIDNQLTSRQVGDVFDRIKAAM